MIEQLVEVKLGGIPIEPILERLYDLNTAYIMANVGSGWGTWFKGFDNSVTDVCPPGTTERRARALMRVLGRVGVVDGCHCGCRGDYELTDAAMSMYVTYLQTHK